MQYFPIIRIAAAYLFFGTVLAVAQQTGSITGIVTDEHAQPVSAATVTASVDSDAAPKTAQTDNVGKFSFSGLPWGKYQVTAEKLEDGYPMTPSEFYGAHAPASTVISADHSSAAINVKFPGKVPMMTGTVIDDESSAPMSATFLFRHASHPANVLSVDAGSNYQIMLPADVGLLLEISAVGYRTWYYPGTDKVTKRTVLRLKPSQILKLNIRLDEDSEDCACLHQPQMWGLGADSPDFQLHGLREISGQQSCTRTVAPRNPQDSYSQMNTDAGAF
jgi:hypothetical protein